MQDAGLEIVVDQSPQTDLQTSPRIRGIFISWPISSARASLHV